MSRRPTIIRVPAEMTADSLAARARGQRVVLVPTMGALHAGHLSLVDEANRRGDRIVVSIFVNPTQFGPKEDFAKYPRDLDGDVAKIATVGADVVFAPEPGAVYAPGFQSWVEVTEVSQGLCGERRPGHFRGVATVVAKLFNMTQPQIAVFGEKDFQQLAVIRRMVVDLDFPIEILGVATMREADGLAMSSRNAYLNPQDRQRAASIFRGLSAARAAHTAGERRASALIDVANAQMALAVDRIEYVEVRDAHTLQPLLDVDRPAVILAAAWVGTTRLIDNVRF